MHKPYFIILAFLSILSSALLAQVGGTIAFQGVLRDPQGTTVVDGSYNLTFKIYDDATSSSNVIYEEDISSVYVSGGVFSVELGTANNTEWQSVPFDETYYVGVSVNNETEMSPRTKLTTSPYSMAVYGANNVVPNNGNVGIGTLSPTASLHVYADDGDDVLNIENSGGVQFNVSTAGTMTIGGDIKIRDTGAGIEFPSGLRQVAPDALHASRGSENSDDLVLESDADISGETDGNNGSGDILMTVAGNTKAVVTNSGNFGIGTTSPSSKLDVAGSVRAYAASADDHVARFDQIYPVGSVYINASNSNNPSTYLGVGTWTRIGEGKVMVGQDGSDADFNQTSDEGGNKTATLNIANLAQHTHTVDPDNTSLSLSVTQNNAGNHNHLYTAPGSTSVDAGADASDNSNNSTGGQNTNVATGDGGSHNHGVGVSGTVNIPQFNSGQTGSGNSFSILQPYIVVYMWVRTG